MKTTAPTFLPVELQQVVMDNLPKDTLLKASTISKGWRQFILKNHLLMHITVNSDAKDKLNTILTDLCKSPVKFPYFLHLQGNGWQDQNIIAAFKKLQAAGRLDQLEGLQIEAAEVSFLMIQALPSNLKILDLQHCHLGTEELKALPSQLEELHFCHWVDTLEKTLIGLHYLPKTLNILTLTGGRKASDGKLRPLHEKDFMHLPIGLRKLTLKAWTFPDALPSDKSSPDKVPLYLKEYCPYLEELSILYCEMNVSNLVAFLPVSLKKLSVAGYINEDALAKLPRGLKALYALFNLSTINLKNLPPSLEKLNIICSDAETKLVTRLLPRTLKKLNCILNDITAQDLKDLPPVLQELTISGEWNIPPEALQFLPQTLRKLKILYGSSFTDRHLEKLPAHITYFSYLHNNDESEITLQGIYSLLERGVEVDGELIKKLTNETETQEEHASSFANQAAKRQKTGPALGI